MFVYSFLCVSFILSFLSCWWPWIHRVASLEDSKS